MNRFTQEDISKVEALLASAKNVVITTHFRPDGDAMGSSLALYNFFKAKGIASTVITPNEFPKFLEWIPSSSDVINYEARKAEADEIIQNASVIFCLDFNRLNRIEKAEESVRNSSAKKVLIDHHIDPEENTFEVSFSYPDASSTCELIYDFIQALKGDQYIDASIGSCLYTGIITDTHSFRFESTKPHVLRMAASLMEKGVQHWKVYENVYDQNSEDKLRLLGYSLSEKLVVLNEYHTAYFSLSQKEMDSFQFESGDTEGLVNYALSIRGIKMAVLFTERNGKVRISFRSTGDFSVQALSSKYFNGGGHKNASGGQSEKTLLETINFFISILPEYKDQLCA